MRDDPYTLSVAVDLDGNAQGTLYIDDEHTFEYRQVSMRIFYMKFEAESFDERIFRSTVPLGVLRMGMLL